MTRAQETAQLINKYIPDLEITYDSNLCEGAPIPPEPKSGRYRPEAKVTERIYKALLILIIYSTTTRTIIMINLEKKTKIIQ